MSYSKSLVLPLPIEWHRALSTISYVYHADILRATEPNPDFLWLYAGPAHPKMQRASFGYIVIQYFDLEPDEPGPPSLDYI